MHSAENSFGGVEPALAVYRQEMRPGETRANRLQTAELTRLGNVLARAVHDLAQLSAAQRRWSLAAGESPPVARRTGAARLLVGRGKDVSDRLSASFHHGADASVRQDAVCSNHHIQVQTRGLTAPVRRIGTGY
jgi:hypothetical protein